MNKPKEIRSLAKLNQSPWYKVKSSFGEKQYIPKILDVNPDSLKEYKNKRRRMKCLLLILIIILVIVAAIIIPILFIQSQSIITTTIINSSTIFTITTTTINCIYPNILNTMGRCVNIMIDSNNCGYIGNICPRNSSCSAGLCNNVPGIQLNNSIAIWSSSVNGSADDQMYHVTLPWNITLYNTTTNNVVVTTDGVFCLGGCSTAYTETLLPSNIFTGATAFAFWDDLYIYINTSQGIYYQSIGNYPNRQLIFEYYMSHYIQLNEYYHFQIIFFENYPGIVQYKYFDATDGGDTCTIGVQGSNNGPFILYSYDQPNSVQQYLTITFDTNQGTFNKSNFR